MALGLQGQFDLKLRLHVCCNSIRLTRLFLHYSLMIVPASGTVMATASGRPVGPSQRMRTW